MTATCVITRAEGAGSTGADGTWTPPPRTTIYTGPCRITMTTGWELTEVVGERQLTSRRYLVAVRYDIAEVAIGDMIEFTAGVDAGLVGVQLRVSNVQAFSEQWERVLGATEYERGA